jgi:hypothetical protein
MIENSSLQQTTNNSLEQLIQNFKDEKQRKNNMFKSLALLTLERRPALKSSKMPLKLSKREVERKEKLKSNVSSFGESLLRKTKIFYTPRMPDEQDEEKVR